MPTKLDGLAGLIKKQEEFLAEYAETLEDEQEVDLRNMVAWLQWSYDFIVQRNLYHKKQTIKKGMMIKMAKTLLDKDELERIEQEAETEAGGE